MAMVAVGGSIGTGLLLGSGAAMEIAGPAAILSFLACGPGLLPGPLSSWNQLRVRSCDSSVIVWSFCHNSQSEG